MPVPQRTVDALNIYSTTGRPFDHEAVRTAQTFAGYAAVALANAALYQSAVGLTHDMQQAMLSRAVIEQAKGVVMTQRRCSPDEAFAMLSEASQRSNRKLRDIAQGIVDGAREGSGGR